jgi:hypothetical protein
MGSGTEKIRGEIIIGGHQGICKVEISGKSRLLAMLTLDYCKLPILPNYPQLGFLGRFLGKIQVIRQ